MHYQRYRGVLLFMAARSPWNQSRTWNPSCLENEAESTQFMCKIGSRPRQQNSHDAQDKSNAFVEPHSRGGAFVCIEFVVQLSALLF
mmetsp:Transcript_78676/g.122796  ORF Transcript_78676/g.122796 Transcript_78676/m.122796 type:complete len:87 (-) Transcript_78676:63-323(-)